jgi:hypothetical protein
MQNDTLYNTFIGKVETLFPESLDASSKIYQVLEKVLYPEDIAFFDIFVSTTNNYYGEEADAYFSEFEEFRQDIYYNKKRDFQHHLDGFIDRIREDYHLLVDIMRRGFSHIAERAKNGEIKDDATETTDIIYNAFVDYLNKHCDDYLPSNIAGPDKSARDMSWTLSFLEKYLGNVYASDLPSDVHFGRTKFKWDIYECIFSDFLYLDEVLPNSTSSDKIDLIEKYLKLGDLLCDSMIANFTEFESKLLEEAEKKQRVLVIHNKLEQRRAEFKCYDLEHIMSKDVVYYISEFFGRPLLYNISFIITCVNTIGGNRIHQKLPTQELCDFVENQITKVSFDYICQMMNSKYFSISHAVKRISLSITESDKTQRLLSGKVLHIKIRDVIKQYQKMIDVKAANQKRAMTCFGCKSVYPLSQLVERHDSKDNLWTIKKRCFTCDSKIAKDLRLVFSPKSYCFSKEGSVLRCV